MTTLAEQVSFPAVTCRFRLSPTLGASQNSFIMAKFDLSYELLSVSIKLCVSKSIMHESAQHNIH